MIRWNWVRLGLLGTLLTETGLAQLPVPDNTLLGNEESVVDSTSVPGLGLIRGGAYRDTNLFHSFEDFSIGENLGAYFLVRDEGVENIFARVTGTKISEILGTLGTRVDNSVFSPSSAHLFLINPNGILFGRNARLDLAGSFIGTTSAGAKFGEIGNFSALESDAPGLLTVQPSAFFFTGVTPNKIEILANQGLDQNLPIVVGLSVPAGQELMFLGGEIELRGSGVNALGGRLELVAVSGVGEVELEGGELLVPEGLKLGDIVLREGARGIVASDGGGNIAVSSRHLKLLNGSFLGAGIFPGQGIPDVQAGNISIRSTGEVRLENTSSVVNNVNRLSQGLGGNISLEAQTLVVESGSVLSASTLGNGNAGNVDIAAQTIILDGTDANRQFANGIFSRVESDAVGRIGNINIYTDSLSIKNGATISADSLGSNSIGAEKQLKVSSRTLRADSSASISTSIFGGDGNAANIDIKVTGESIISNDSIISSETFSQGRGGDILIESRKLILQEGGQISSGSGRENFQNGFFGPAGNITINVEESVELDGYGFLNRSGIFSETASANTSGQINLNASTLAIRNGAAVASGSSGSGSLGGDGGNIVIDVPEKVEVIGRGRRPSAITTEARPQGAAIKPSNAGDLKLLTDLLLVKEGGAIASIALSEVEGEATASANAGNIFIRSRTTEVSDPGSFISSDLLKNTIGQGGDIEIQSQNMTVRNGGFISASTKGIGNAGNIEVLLTNRLTLQGTNLLTGESSGLYASNGDPGGDIGTGASGSVLVAVPELIITEGALIDVRTLNEQAGGNIRLGLNTANFLNGGQVLTTSDSTGPSGSISITATESVNIAGTDITYADRLIEFPETTASTNGNSALSSRANSASSAGDIILNTPELLLDERGQIIAESAIGNGGNIFIGTSSDMPEFADIPVVSPDIISLRNGSLISASAGDSQNPGDGGNITIDADLLIGLPNENSDIIANAFEGTGGNITINADAILNFELQDEPNVDTLRANTTNDISASSAIGNDGLLNLAGLNIDPSQGTNELPSIPNAPADQISRRCSADRTAATTPNALYITGRGGIPPRPSEPTTGTYRTGQIAQTEDPNPTSTLPTALSPRPTPNLLQEASSWQKTAQGNIQLIAQRPNPPQIGNTDCHPNTATAIQP